MAGHHLHAEYVGREVTVRTPGDIPHQGLLIAVGPDRLVLNTASGIEAVTRLFTTRLDVEAEGGKGA